MAGHAAGRPRGQLLHRWPPYWCAILSIDHVGEKLAGLDFMVQEGQSTLRALQREREVFERLEQSIKSLRGRAVAPVEKSA